jgi:hypothetical protein
MSIIVMLRSARSRDISFTGRSYEIRYYHPNGGEDFLKFLTRERTKIELKAKDMVVFSFADKTIKVIQNLTINDVSKVTVPSGRPYSKTIRVALILTTLFVLAAVLMVALG